MTDLSEPTFSKSRFVASINKYSGQSKGIVVAARCKFILREENTVNRNGSCRLLRQITPQYLAGNPLKCRTRVCKPIDVTVQSVEYTLLPVNFPAAKPSSTITNAIIGIALASLDKRDLLLLSQRSQQLMSISPYSLNTPIHPLSMSLVFAKK